MKKPRVAYVMTFPVLSETFILREMRELRRRGVDLRILSIRTPDQRVAHGDADELKERTVYAPFLASGRVIGANLRMFAKRPKAYLRAMKDVIQVSRGMPKELAKALYPAKFFDEKEIDGSAIAHPLVAPGGSRLQRSLGQNLAHFRNGYVIPINGSC